MVELLQRYARSHTVASQLLLAQRAAQKCSQRPLTSSISPQPVRRRLPKTLHLEIVTAYEAGATTRQLAQLYGVSKTNIEDLLHRAGVIMRNRSLTQDQVQEARILHDSGLSTYAIAKKFGVVQSTVWRALQS